MFYYINGALVNLTPTSAAIDCGGVAYKMTISGNTYSKLSQGPDEPVKLYTYLHIREDIMELYGFYEENELNTFLMLIGVSGVGPKAAMAILSQMSPQAFAVAVIHGDFKQISKANGVGAKTAQRVILELKDKLAKQSAGLSGGGDEPMLQTVESSENEIVNALCVLGYSRQEATAAAKKAVESGEKDLEGAIRASLRFLMR